MRLARQCQPTHGAGLRRNGRDKTWQGDAAFGRASGMVSRAALGEALPNVCFVTGFTCEAGPEAIGGLHRQGEAMKSWLHAAYTSI